MLQSLLGMMGLDLDSAPLWYDHTTGEPRSFSQSLRVTARGSVVSTPAATLVALVFTFAFDVCDRDSPACFPLGLLQAHKVRQKKTRPVATEAPVYSAT